MTSSKFHNVNYVNYKIAQRSSYVTNANQFQRRLFVSLFTRLSCYETNCALTQTHTLLQLTRTQQCVGIFNNLVNTQIFCLNWRNIHKEKKNILKYLFRYGIQCVSCTIIFCTYYMLNISLRHWIKIRCVSMQTNGKSLIRRDNPYAKPEHKSSKI